MLGVSAFKSWAASGRWALAAMFLLTGFSHFAPSMRAEFEAMVPPVLGAPGFWVTLTGVLEIAGAVGLLIPRTRVAAGWALALLLVAMFPANVREIQEGLTLRGEAPAPMLIRLPMQLLYIGWAIWAARAGRESPASVREARA